MFGMLGSLLGSAASGLFGMAGQSSANAANLKLDSTKYQRASADMQAAGLNPAAMYNGGTPGPAPQMQSTMQAPAAALKDGASSAVAMKIADKTIENLTEQIAKTNADTANVKAGTPGIAARSDLDVMKSGAIKAIPEVIRTPIYQSGFGADTLSSAGKIPAAIAAGTAAGAAAVPKIVDLNNVSLSSAKSAVHSIKRKYDSMPSYSEAEREAARLRNAKRWGWLTGSSARGSVQAKQ